MTSQVVVGVDIGGTRIKSAVMTVDGTVVDELVTPTPKDLGDAIGPVVRDLTRNHLNRCAESGLEVAGRAVGVVVPGVVDDALGVGRNSASLGWHDLEVRSRVAAELELPVAVSHDVRAGLVAESRFGAAVGIEGVRFVPVGTGIASAALVGGHMIADPHSGEIGHVVVRHGGEVCGCDARGCLETIASARAIGRRFEQATGAACGSAAAAEVSRLVTAARDRAQSVQAGAAQGASTSTALRIWQEAVEALASVLAPVAAALGTERILIGGGLVRAGQTLLEPLREATHARLGLARPVDVGAAALGDRAGALAAGALAELVKISV